MSETETPERLDERPAGSAASQADKLGLPPGTLVHVGERHCAEVALTLVAYGPEGVGEIALGGPEDLAGHLGTERLLWLDVIGLHDVETVGEVGEVLGLHPLVMSDMVNTHQRPKAEIHEDYVFAVVKMVRWIGGDQGLDTEQVSLLLGRNWVATFQERPGDVFDAVRARMREGKGRIRKSGSDYLFYALLDVIVDHYFLAVEALSEQTEALEDEVLEAPTRDTLARIHGLRQEALALRRAAWPLRELVQVVLREESELVNASTAPYLRDLYDHVVQVIDIVETQREILAGYTDLYLSSLSNRMNDVMRVLTVIATIFIPLTFVAGIYGMNFEFMPELKWRWGYPLAWGVMAVMAGGMLRFFRRRGWF
ncbi:MAG TPA: magnesium/cobalt transporter CorA [Deferrisomatales bacterium]|nr:magnesium/cobalt transporter CorA [Deferrisomatales bacterium]